MGSFTRVKVFYTNLSAFIKEVNVEVHGAFLEGKNLHDVKFGNEGLIVIGNESTGISPEIEQYIKNKITVPRFGGAESLNAAMSTAVICDNLRRYHGSDFPSFAK
jgi:TrmH family RNA methyltransferase